jgi:hypothetical protein
MHVYLTKDCKKFSHVVLWPRWMCFLRVGSQMTVIARDETVKALLAKDQL